MNCAWGLVSLINKEAAIFSPGIKGESDYQIGHSINHIFVWIQLRHIMKIERLLVINSLFGAFHAYRICDAKFDLNIDIQFN